MGRNEVSRLERYLCKLGFHSWTYSPRGGVRTCDVCNKHQIWDWFLTDEWKDVDG